MGSHQTIGEDAVLWNVLQPTPKEHQCLPLDKRGEAIEDEKLAKAESEGRP
jgi:hypothetical protein